MKKKKKYTPGRKCVIDAGTPYEEPAVIKKAPFTDHGDTFIVVIIASEEMSWISETEYEYFPRTFEVRIPIERITLK